MEILFFNFIDESKRIFNKENNSILFAKKGKNRIDDKISKKKKLKCTNCKKTRHLKKNCYFFHSELRFKNSRDKSSSSRIEEEIISFSEMTMTALDA